MGVRDGEARAEIVPERDPQFETGFCQTNEAVAAVGTRVTAGATANLSPCHLSANVIFRSIGVERNLGTLEHHEQFGLLFVQPSEQTVECDESGLELEDAIEPCQQHALAPLSRTATVSLQGTVVVPDQITDVALGEAMLVGEDVEFVNEAFGVHLIWSST